MLALDDHVQFDMLESSLVTGGGSSVLTFLWQVAVGLPAEPASIVIATMHKSAIHSGNSISLSHSLFH